MEPHGLMQSLVGHEVRCGWGQTTDQICPVDAGEPPTGLKGVR